MPSTAPEKSLVRRSPILRAIRWWTLRRLSLTIAWVATLVILLHSIYLWRGKRAWLAYVKEVTARGETLDPNAFVPAPVPDEQNFAMTPLLAPLCDYEWDSRSNHWRWRNEAAYQRTMEFGAAFSWPTENRTIKELMLPAVGAENGIITNSAARAAAATVVLRKLKEYEPQLDELRQASHRPFSRFNIHYDNDLAGDVLLPHLDILRRAGKIISLRASAELALGQGEAAFADIDLILSLANASRAEPFLFSQFQRVGLLREALRVIREGLATRLWTDPQWQRLQGELEPLNLLADLSRTQRADLAQQNHILDQLREARNWKLFLFGSEQASGDPVQSAIGFVVELLPRGWFYLNQLEFNRLYHDRVLPGLNPQARRVYPSVISTNQTSLEAAARSPLRAIAHNQLFGMLLLFKSGSPANFDLQFARFQCELDQAVIACGLERYRLVNNAYPETLAELTPRYLDQLPHDLIGGEPLHYRRQTDGAYLLYSIGWNERDDHGVQRPLRAAKSSWSVDRDGDWVW